MKNIKRNLSQKVEKLESTLQAKAESVVVPVMSAETEEAEINQALKEKGLTRDHPNLQLVVIKCY